MRRRTGDPNELTADGQLDRNAFQLAQPLLDQPVTDGLQFAPQVRQAEGIDRKIGGIDGQRNNVGNPRKKMQRLKSSR